ncbi:carboxylesterase type B [Jatrophihabitans sp. GAS493]|uniref:carboxylesterase/lipase family protein n=1 Tax=Jatrophihabitans sp. GAS493 TaxID=1907575 RepID=UPI000BC06DEC|nr:carboxylesterase/lipase family protein [Jatrophihabitans sp. GAS493]SOD71391.1 carboxylesterase type B [Jatrophihabitans sp. GAS493]
MTTSQATTQSAQYATVSVEIEQGTLRGIVIDAVSSFKGIPYAAPPFGELRFQAPAAPPHWVGERDASQYGPTVPKPPYPKPIDEILPEPSIDGDDVLNLNVWTPAGATGGLPVFVWIHGGAFVNGTGAVSTYDGSNFARDGVVCVTINYRLGADGFLLLDGAPANRGLLDQIAALQWVQRNIAAFGGDPTRVTIGGESAGAMSVTTLLALPAARGLFRAAITESGAGHHAHSAETAAKVTAALAQRLGVEATVAGFGGVPIPELMDAQAALSRDIAKMPDPTKWGEVAGNMMAFEPCIDGELITRLPIQALADGASADVALLTGTNTDEHTLFLVPTGIEDAVNDQALLYILGSLGADATKAVAAYREGLPDATDGQLFTAALTDWFFRVPAIRQAEARAVHGADTYMYEFAWRSPQYGGRLGAAHAFEIGFAFDNLDDVNLLAATGPNPPQSVADTMHAAWVCFVTSGAPGWPVYGEARTVRVFDTDSRVVTDPRAAQRQIWDGIR